MVRKSHCPPPAQCQWLLNILKHHSRFQPESGSTVKFNVLGIFDGPPPPTYTFTDIATMCLGFYTASSGRLPALEENLKRQNFTKYFPNDLYWIISAHKAKRLCKVRSFMGSRHSPLPLPLNINKIAQAPPGLRSVSMISSSSNTSCPAPPGCLSVS